MFTADLSPALTDRLSIRPRRDNNNCLLECSQEIIKHPTTARARDASGTIVLLSRYWQTRFFVSTICSLCAGLNIVREQALKSIRMACYVNLVLQVSIKEETSLLSYFLVDHVVDKSVYLTC